jgi:hypothetical protein
VSAGAAFEPIVRAARAKIGGTLRTPLSVTVITDQSVPMITTKRIAASVCPNLSSAPRHFAGIIAVHRPSVALIIYLLLFRYYGRR